MHEVLLVGVRDEEVLLAGPPGRGDTDLLLDPAYELLGGLVLIEVPDDLLLEKVWEQADDGTLPPLVVHRLASEVPVGPIQAVPALDRHRNLLIGPALLGVHNQAFQANLLDAGLLDDVEEDEAPGLEAIALIDVFEDLPGVIDEAHVEEAP